MPKRKPRETPGKTSAGDKSTGEPNETPSQKKRTSKKLAGSKTASKKAVLIKRDIEKTTAQKAKMKSAAVSHGNNTHTANSRPKTRAVVAQSDVDDKFTLLQSALTDSGFWTGLADTQIRAGVERDDFRILIKPDLSMFDRGVSTGTDPELVERIIDLLHEKGYNQVAVCNGRNSFDLWLENRDVMVAADLLGYRFITEGARL